MRTHTLFAVALTTFMIHFSDAAETNTLNKRIAPVDGLLASAVTAGGTGNLVGTAAGLVAANPAPSPDRKKRGLPLTGALGGVVSGINVAGLGASDKGAAQKQSTGGLLGKRDLLGGLLGGGGGGGGGGSGHRGGNYGPSMYYRPDDIHGDHFYDDDEFTKRSNMEKRDLLGGLPVVGSVLGGGGKAKPQAAPAGISSGGSKGGNRRQKSGGKGSKGKARKGAAKAMAKPAAAKASKGGLLGGSGGLPLVGGLLKRDLLGGGGGLPVVGGLLGGGGGSNNKVKQAAASGKGRGRGRKANSGHGRGRGRGRYQNNNGRARPGKASGGGPLGGGGLPIVGSLLKRDVLGRGLPIVGGLLGGGSKKNIAKQAATGRGRKANGGRGRGRNQKNSGKVRPAKASGGGLLGGGLPVVGGLLR